MPLFYQHTINPFTKLGVWRIEENEPFFLLKVPLKKEVTHPAKRLQHLAGRYLLPSLFERFPVDEIIIADTRKPFLKDEAYHFSISHCGNFAAALVSTKNRVGIDIEIVSPRISRIADKFLSPFEKELLFSSSELPKFDLPIEELLLTTAWSAKEAIYKWFGDGGVDFREHIRLASPLQTNSAGAMSFQFQFLKTPISLLTVQLKIFNEFVLAFTMTN